MYQSHIKPQPTTTFNMVPLFLALLTVAAAHPDPATLFETISMPEQEMTSYSGRNDLDGIKNVLKEQGIVLAEATFSNFAKSSCMARELCNFGANAESRFFPLGEITIGTAIDTFTVRIK